MMCANVSRSHASVVGFNMHHCLAMHHLACYRRNATFAAARTVGCCTLLILTAEGAPGKPGWQVLYSLTALKSPWPQLLMADTLNL